MQAASLRRRHGRPRQGVAARMARSRSPWCTSHRRSSAMTHVCTAISSSTCSRGDDWAVFVGSDAPSADTPEHRSKRAADGCKCVNPALFTRAEAQEWLDAACLAIGAAWLGPICGLALLDGPASLSQFTANWRPMTRRSRIANLFARRLARVTAGNDFTKQREESGRGGVRLVDTAERSGVAAAESATSTTIDRTITGTGEPPFESEPAATGSEVAAQLPEHHWLDLGGGG